MRVPVITVALTALALTTLALAACDSGGSAVETRPRPAAAEAALIAAPVEAVEADPQPPGPSAKPVVTANRRESVDVKVQRLFDRNGADFGAKTAGEYLERLTSFTSSPPRGTERIKRANGDVLLYQASSNTFAVVAEDGTPRTMFKPRDGAAYWAEQKERAPTFGQRRSSDNTDG